MEYYRNELSIYLISETRIVNLVIANNALKRSTEHNIQKDIKKVEIEDELKVGIHYHGLHNPEYIIVENYDEAVYLRKKLNLLREKNFNYKKN